MSSALDSQSSTPVAPPIALSVAGSDCSAGAGIQADLKTFGACGTYGLTAVTCVVAEAPDDFRGVAPLAPAFVAEQIATCLAHYPVAAAKLGALGAGDIAEALAGAFSTAVEAGLPLVIDPVTEATAGGSLGGSDVLKVLRDRLLPIARIVTPNLAEAAAIIEGPELRSREDMEKCALQIASEFGCAVFLKGGHLETDGEAADVLVDEKRIEWFSSPRLEGASSLHGTGCTLSAAICAGLAHRGPLSKVVGDAKAFVAEAIERSHRWPSPSGDSFVHALDQCQDRE